MQILKSNFPARLTKSGQDKLQVKTLFGLSICELLPKLHSGFIFRN